MRHGEPLEAVPLTGSLWTFYNNKMGSLACPPPQTCSPSALALTFMGLEAGTQNSHAPTPVLSTSAGPSRAQLAEAASHQPAPSL